MTSWKRKWRLTISAALHNSFCISCFIHWRLYIRSTKYWPTSIQSYSTHSYQSSSLLPTWTLFKETLKVGRLSKFTMFKLKLSTVLSKSWSICGNWLKVQSSISKITNSARQQLMMKMKRVRAGWSHFQSIASSYWRKTKLSKLTIVALKSPGKTSASLIKWGWCKAQLQRIESLMPTKT